MPCILLVCVFSIFGFALALALSFLLLVKLHQVTDSRLSRFGRAIVLLLWVSAGLMLAIAVLFSFQTSITSQTPCHNISQGCIDKEMPCP